MASRALEIEDVETGEVTEAVYEHPFVVRLCHWVNAVSLFVMVGSGFQIFRAFPSFGAKIPQKDLLNWPKSFALGGWLGGALQWMFEVLLGFSQRLHRRLDENTHRDRRGFLGWMVAAAVTVLVAGSFEVARSSVSSHPELRSEHAQPGAGVPPDMLVLVATDGKTFHASGCPFIHEKHMFRQSPHGKPCEQGMRLAFAA